MIAFRQESPAKVDVGRYRTLLGPDADGLSDEQLQEQLDADRLLARAICTAISTMVHGSDTRVAS